MTGARAPGRERLGIDARMIDAVGGTGVSTYARSLLAAARLLDRDPVLIHDAGVRLGDVSRVLRSLRFGARRLAPGAGGGAASLTAADIFRIGQVHFTTYGRLLPLRAPGRPGIMHWTYPLPLRLIGWKNVYTVHDAIPLAQPDLTPIPAERHGRMLRAILRHASAIATVSEDARAAIIAATGCDPGRVVDLGQSVSVPDAPPPPADHPPGGYFLFCGSIEPRKNLVRLANAYRASGTRLPLLLAGPDSWRTPEIMSGIMAATGGQGTIRRLPYQSRPALMGLIAHARALLFPSLAEGFGLPVAEAMTLGTAVMTSAGGALAETAGGAALLVDPLDERAMAGAIARLSHDDGLVADLVRRGRARAPAFAPARFAARLGAFHAGL